MIWHDKNDSIEQLRSDAEDADDHTPDSIRDSAKAELRRRGFCDVEIQNIRIYGHENGKDA